MSDLQLKGRRILLVEDEYIIAFDLAEAFEDAGAEVIGPASTIRGALKLLAQYPQIDAALLDVNVDGGKVYPVANALALRGVPFLFSTGYDTDVIEARFGAVISLMKPIVARYAVHKIAQAISPSLPDLGQSSV